MPAVTTVMDLEASLSEDLSWRKQEITALWKEVSRPRSKLAGRQCFIRAGVAMLYAHWEGYVRRTAITYIDYVSRRRIVHDLLTPNFSALSLKRQLSATTISAKPVSMHLEMLGIIDRLGTERFGQKGEKVITTHSNLNSELFSEILLAIGADYTGWQTKAQMINETLLGNRNSIAHGTYVSLDPGEYHQLQQSILGILDEFKDVVIDLAQNQSYMK